MIDNGITEAQVRAIVSAILTERGYATVAQVRGALMAIPSTPRRSRCADGCTCVHCHTDRALAALDAQPAATGAKACTGWVCPVPRSTPHVCALHGFMCGPCATCKQPFSAHHPQPPLRETGEIPRSDLSDLGWMVEAATPTAPASQPARRCGWTEQPDTGAWDTGCGETFCIEEGTPHDNSMRFCCYCGKPLDVVVPGEPDDDVRPAPPAMPTVEGPEIERFTPYLDSGIAGRFPAMSKNERGLWCRSAVAEAWREIAMRWRTECENRRLESRRAIAAEARADAAESALREREAECEKLKWRLADLQAVNSLAWLHLPACTGDIAAAAATLAAEADALRAEVATADAEVGHAANVIEELRAEVARMKGAQEPVACRHKNNDGGYNFYGDAPCFGPWRHEPLYALPVDSVTRAEHEAALAKQAEEFETEKDGATAYLDGLKQQHSAALLAMQEQTRVAVRAEVVKLLRQHSWPGAADLIAALPDAAGGE